MSNEMMEIYVLNGDLQPLALIDNYTSLIWANRYVEEGDCELYIEATAENLQILRKGNYLKRADDDMICRIEKIELETDVENGNFLIITGYDVKKFLKQRVIWNMISVDGKTEDYIRQIIQENLVTPNQSSRYITNASGRPNFFLGDRAGFSEVITEQVSYKNVGEKIEEICTKYGWGFKIIMDSTTENFYFILYKGDDRSESVIFAPEFENIISTTYTDDKSNFYNVALVGGEGEGSERSRNVSGYAEGLDRSEIFVDAKDISRTISYDELTDLYPHGSIYPQGAATFGHWRMDYINVPKVDAEQFREVKERFPNGQEVWIDGNVYWQCYDVDIAVLQRESADEDFEVTLLDVVYNTYLINRGYEKLAEFPEVISFEGSVDPETTFTYKRDYFLGDIVSVRNEYGIEAQVRIVEVVELWDTNGHTIEPKFEYLNMEV